jgi:hypothetical protein
VRPLDEWTEADLQALIDGDVQESLTLDYKRSDALARTNESRSEIAKDVSAFANSVGGRIVYGIEEQANRAVRIDGGCRDPKITREWIEQVLSSTIQPRVQGLTIRPIPVAAGGTAYVIDIPQAVALAPHQAPDRKYYRRFNFQSEPMYDYEVRDALRRSMIGQPDVWFNWAILPNAVPAPHCRLSAAITNLSSEPILYAHIQFLMDRSLFGVALPQVANFEAAQVDAEMSGQGVRPMLRLTRNLMQSNHMPIFKEQAWNLFNIDVPVPDTVPRLLQYEVSFPGGTVRRNGVFQFINGLVQPVSDGCETMFR